MTSHSSGDHGGTEPMTGRLARPEVRSE
jgi:hypothetical protein